MRQSDIILVVAALTCAILSSSCSTQKNTWASRTYHATTTKYNIYFNGNTSYAEGIKAINTANQDDYTKVLPLYAISNPQSAGAATSQMDRSIEKCRKCIKLHSIKAKPKPNPKKRNDPKYKAFLQQEEFNYNMDDAWILLAKSEFHKGDFLGSIGTFNYIIRHYANDKDMVAQCQLWEVRAYAELGWMYEAEDLFQKVKQDDLKRKHASLYAATAADLNLKAERYKQAIPFIKLSLPDEPHEQKARCYYILGQLYKLQGEKNTAANMFKKVGQYEPSAEMDFNAKLQRTTLKSDIKSLNRMAKLPKNKDKLDYIYGAVGDIYLQQKDTAKALENYALAAEKSTQNGMQKASVLIKEGDIYYAQSKYVLAAPCYKDASQIISPEDKDYKRISKLAQTLDELAVEATTVELQDSLQYLATLSEEEQLKIINKIIEDIEKQEKEAAEQAAQAARNQDNDDDLMSVNTSNMIGGSMGKADWYFYNANLIKNGKQEFKKKWGNRQLEDNWRRSNKTTVALFNQEPDDMNLPADSLNNDSTQQNTQQLVSDNKDPKFYLQQIPTTAEQLDASNSQIATALYNMVGIYRDKIEDERLTNETLEEFDRRFPEDKRLVELYYQKYLNCIKQNSVVGTDSVRAVKDAATFCTDIKQIIISRFADTEQAEIVSQDDYFDQLKHIEAAQDSLYEEDYNAYIHNEFNKVKSIKLYAEDHFSQSKLMPRFLFLNSVAVARTEGQEPFIESLRDLAARYPDSEMGSMAKDMLAKMNAGLESQKGGDNSSLMELRKEIEEEPIDSTLIDRTFIKDRKMLSEVLIVATMSEEELNKLLYEVALFNFSQFLIKDFDLKPMPVFHLQEGALKITGFESMDEADWYRSLIENNADIAAMISRLNARIICITEPNLQLIGTRYTLSEYEEFIKQ